MSDGEPKPAVTLAVAFTLTKLDEAVRAMQGGRPLLAAQRIGELRQAVCEQYAAQRRGQSLFTIAQPKASEKLAWARSGAEIAKAERQWTKWKRARLMRTRWLREAAAYLAGMLMMSRPRP